MSFREALSEYSKGNDLGWFWRLFHCREAAGSRFTRGVFTFLANRSAHRHGGYIGPGAVIRDVPILPHGLHGVFISRYAVIGKNCRIYQNVTIGEVRKKAPVIGDNCLIGAGAVLVGNIRIGNNVLIGAGAVIFSDLPDHCTAVAPPPRLLRKGTNRLPTAIIAEDCGPETHG